MRARCYTAAMLRLRAAALVFWAVSGLSAAELTSEQWRADLAFLAKELPQRHKNLYHTLPKAEFERRVEELSTAVPKLSELEIRAGIARIVAAVADGHTSADLESDRTIDLSFLECPEGLYVTGGAKEYEQAIGARVTAIDGVTVAEVRKRLLEFVHLENEFAAREYAAWLPNVAAMRAAHILQAPEAAEFRLEKGGRSFTMSVRTRLRKAPRPERATPAVQWPLWQQRGDTPYWWKYLPESKTLYIQYNSCMEMASLPFRKFTEEIVQQAAREAPEKVVLDVRNNGGGNSEVVRPLQEAMQAHAELRPKGGVYVLVGVGTYSSGFLNAIDFREQFEAFVAGEPPSERPNHYGNMQTFRLPNSGIVISYSTKYFAPLDDDPPALLPELNVRLTAADFFAGRDAVLDAVLKLPASVEKNFEDTIARDRASVRAYAALARLYEKRGREADAEAVLKKGLAANPRATLLAVALAAHYERLKKYQNARLALDGLRTAGALCALGQVNLDDRKYAAAEAAYRECFRQQPDDIRGLRGIGGVYGRQNKAAEAIRILSAEADRVPGDVDLRMYVGKFASGAGQWDVAAAEYEKALALPAGRRRFELWLELSDIYRRKPDSTAAMRAFDSACQAITELLESMPVDPGMIYGYVRGYYEQALRREPNDPVLKQIVARLAAMPAKP
jgi:tetratricopeptide (TPR) repeat protein